MESILTSIKKLLGVPEEYQQFDPDIIMHINSVLVTLNQMGVGPDEGFTISDASTTWEEYLGDNMPLQGNVISFVHLNVKILFDPASLSSSTLAAYERQIAQLEWRITAMAESLNKITE